MEPKKLYILAIQSIRKSLERKTDDERVKDKYFIPYIRYLLMCDGNEALQTEAAWIFTNIAAGSSAQTKIVVESGAIPLLVRLLSSPNKELVEQCIWALGNIIGDNVEYRDSVLEYGTLDLLLSLVTENMATSFQRTVAWVLVNIVRCRDHPLSLEVISEITPKLCQLATRRDISTKTDALWALTFIADCGEDYIALIVDNDIVDRIIMMISSHNQKLQVAAMRLLGNIATGSDEQTQVLLDNGILNNLRFAVTNHNRNLRRIALWCLSNISVGTVSQAQEVFYSGLLPVIVDNLSHIDTRVAKEAMLTIRNLINSGTTEQMLDIIDCRAINPMFTLIMSEDFEIAEAARQALNTLFLKGGQLVDKYSRMYEQMMNTSSSP